MRDERWKLVHFVDSPEGQLFDLDADPREVSNLWDNPAHAERRREMVEEILRWRTMTAMTPAPLPEYTAVLVRGVVDNWRSINEALETYAKGWSLERMPAVDRALLRVSAYEVLYVEDVPNAVAVSEALILVRDLSTDESPAFVNGVLGNIVRDCDTLAR